MRNSKVIGEALGLKTHTCDVCKKVFECGSQYVYKMKTHKSEYFKYFCSYKCYRTKQKEVEHDRVRSLQQVKTG